LPKINLNEVNNIDKGNIKEKSRIKRKPSYAHMLQSQVPLS